jgi:hypothetical protein
MGSGLNLDRGMILSSLTEACPVSYSAFTGWVFLVGKRPWREVHLAQTFSAEVKNEWS